MIFKCKNNHPSSGQGRFCSECGSPLFAVCPGCGALSDPGGKFCSSCGCSLQSEAKQKDGGGSKYNFNFRDAVVGEGVTININEITPKEEHVCCTVCGSNIPDSAKHLHLCRHCGKHFCNMHMDLDLGICNGCRENDVAIKFEKAKKLLVTRDYNEATAILKDLINSPYKKDSHFFYLAIALLKGKKPFLHDRGVISEVTKSINAAININELPVYHYFMAYVKYDFFARKRYAITPGYTESLKSAYILGLTEEDVNKLHILLSTDRPDFI